MKQEQNVVSNFTKFLFLSLSLCEIVLFGAHSAPDWQKTITGSSTGRESNGLWLGPVEMGIVEAVSRPNEHEAGHGESGHQRISHQGQQDFDDEEEKLSLSEEITNAIEQGNLSEVQSLMNESDASLALREANDAGETPLLFARRLQQEAKNGYEQSRYSAIVRELEQSSTDQIQNPMDQIQQLLMPHLKKDVSGIVKKYLFSQWKPTDKPIVLENFIALDGLDVVSPNGNYAAFYGFICSGSPAFPYPLGIIIVNMHTHEKTTIVLEESCHCRILFSPDSQYLAVIFENGKLQIYRTPKKCNKTVSENKVEENQEEQKEEIESEEIGQEDWRVCHNVQLFSKKACAGAFSPDSKHFVVYGFVTKPGKELPSSEPILYLYDTDAFKQGKIGLANPIAEIPLPKEYRLRSHKCKVCFSPDGKHILASDGYGESVCFEMVKWQEGHRLKGDSAKNKFSWFDQLGKLNVSPHGRYKVEMQWYRLAPIAGQSETQNQECCILRVVEVDTNKLVFRKILGSRPGGNIKLTNCYETYCIFNPFGYEVLAMFGNEVHILSLDLANDEQTNIEPVPELWKKPFWKKALGFVVFDVPYKKIAKSAVAVWAGYKAYQNRQRVAQWLREWRG